MNKKVFVSMLTLCVVFLVGLYIAKIFFPQEFVMTVSNKQLIKVGQFIDSSKWLFFLFGTITAFITYYLYCCASCGRKFLKWYEIFEILGVVLIVKIISPYNNSIASAIELSAFLFLPALMKGYLKNAAITFTIHGIAQVLSLSIRNLPMYLATKTTLSIILLAIDMYLWLVLCYVIFNYKKEN